MSGWGFLLWDGSGKSLLGRSPCTGGEVYWDGLDRVTLVNVQIQEKRCTAEGGSPRTGGEMYGGGGVFIWEGSGYVRARLGEVHVQVERCTAGGGFFI